MAHQFASLEGWGLKTSKQSSCKSGRTVRGIINEAVRVPSACRHVAEPRRPVFIGTTAEDLKARARELRDLAGDRKDSLGRRQRADTQILLSLVASYPVPWSEVKRDKAKRAEVSAWIDRVVAFGKAEFGSAFKGGVIHFDEEYPHGHLYADLDGGSIKALHPGHAAAAAAAKAQKGEAYRQAMEAFQARFHAAVSAPLGHAPKSDQPRKRLPRGQHMAGVRRLKGEKAPMRRQKPPARWKPPRTPAERSQRAQQRAQEALQASRKPLAALPPQPEAAKAALSRLGSTATPRASAPPRPWLKNR